jgi:hypothetical protein
VGATGSAAPSSGRSSVARTAHQTTRQTYTIGSFRITIMKTSSTHVVPLTPEA